MMRRFIIPLVVMTLPLIFFLNANANGTHTLARYPVKLSYATT